MTTRTNRFVSMTRRVALAALIGSSLVLIGCSGGGKGDKDGKKKEDPMPEPPVVTPAPQLEYTVDGDGDLDGVVFGDNAQVQSRTDLQPGVGDFSAQGATGTPRSVAYFSFDLPELPAGAQIKSATLSLYNRATQGDPQGMMVLVRVDHVNYGTLFPQTLLGAQGLDFNIATISDIGTLGRKNIDVTEQVQADVDAGRERSQYRLRGAIASNLDNVADIALLTDGEDSFGTGEVPMLIIELEE